MMCNNNMNHSDSPCPPFFRGCGPANRGPFGPGNPFGDPQGGPAIRGPFVPAEPFRGPQGRPPACGRHRPHHPHPFPPAFDPESLAGLWFRANQTLERKPMGHRGVRRVLRLLNLADGSLSQRDLTEVLNVQPGSLSELLTKMENRGLITRERQEDDRRHVTVLLTEAGLAKAKEPGPGDMFSVLDESEKEQLRAILKKLTEAWEPKLPQPPETKEL